MYQDGLKVFNFTYPDEKENPLPSTAFDQMRIVSNMRGFFTDLQIFSRFFKTDDMVAWTTSCSQSKGDIFSWDKTKLDTSQTTDKNVTFLRFDLSEACPDPNKKVTMQQPKISASSEQRCIKFCRSLFNSSTNPYLITSIRDKSARLKLFNFNFSIEKVLSITKNRL